MTMSGPSTVFTSKIASFRYDGLAIGKEKPSSSSSCIIILMIAGVCHLHLTKSGRVDFENFVIRYSVTLLTVRQGTHSG